MVIKSIIRITKSVTNKESFLHYQLLKAMNNHFSVRTFTYKIFLFSMVLLAFNTLQVHAQKAEVYTEKGMAINGYDPVSYFKEGKPVAGIKSYTYGWHGALWYFSNSENLEAFKTSPEKYAPQYGGYCAYAVAKGYKATTDPDAWAIVNGKLYLNYSKSIAATWNKDRQGYITKADRNWPDVKDKE